MVWTAARVMRGMFSVAFIRWWRWRAKRRTQQRVRASCERREQRLEDANVPTWQLSSLHSLAYAAFNYVERERADVDRLLDLYTELAVQRRWYQAQLRAAPDRLLRRWTAYLRVLDEHLADVEALIRLYCEHSMYDCGWSTPAGAPSALRRINH